MLSRLPTDDLLRITGQLPTAVMSIVGGRVETANQYACRQFELPLEKIVGRKLSDLLQSPEEKVTQFLRNASRSSDSYLGVLTVSANGLDQEVRCECHVLTPPQADGPAQLLLTMTPHEKSVKSFVALNQKIDALNDEIARRHATEVSLLKHVRLVSFARDVGVALANSNRPQSTLDNCAEIFVKSLNAEFAGIWARTRSKGGLVLTGVAGGDASSHKQKSSIEAALHSVVSRVESEKRPLLENDLSDRAELLTELLGEMGKDGAMIAFPLIVEDDVVGVLVLLSAKVFPVETVQAVDSVLSEIAISIDRSRVEFELARQTKSLRVADQRKDEFLAMLAHELRNPLAPIKSGLDLLKLDDAESETIRIMQNQVDHLVRLVDDLLDVSRVMRGRIQLQKEPTAIRQLLKNAITTTRPMFEARNHRLITELPDEDIWVLADEVRMTQVFTNLINNATKYTPDNGTIELAFAGSGDSVTVTVKDNGIGVESEYASEMFDLFSQSTRTIDRSEGGLGVGLTVVQNLVKLHDGQISVHSAGLNRGTEFKVTLPTIEPLPGAGESKSESQTQPESTGSRRVLVVDDMRGAAIMLKRLVSKYWHHEIELAHDGETACLVAEGFKPDVVLLDIGLPGINGYEVAQKLREQPGLSKIRIVAISGYGTEKDRQKSADAGIDLHFAKPVGVEQLVEVFGNYQN